MKRAWLVLPVAMTAAVLVAACAYSILGDARTSSIAAPALLAAVGVAFGLMLAGTGRRAAGVGVAAVALALVTLFLGVAASRPAQLPTPVLLEGDREGLAEIELGDGRWVAHATLGFRLPQPTIDLSPEPDLVRETVDASAPGWVDVHQLWAFATGDGHTSVVIDLSRIADADADAIEYLARSVVDPLRSAGHSVRESEPHVGEGCGSEGIEASLRSGGRFDARVFVFEDPLSHRAFGLVIHVVGPAETSWSDYLARVVVPCRRS